MRARGSYMPFSNSSTQQMLEIADRDIMHGTANPFLSKDGDRYLTHSFAALMRTAASIKSHQ